MFCPCYFSTVPSGHAHGSGWSEHYCRFNMAYRINQGRFNGVALDGLKFWIAGDLGADFSKSGEWAEITFEPSATKQQREAITTIVPNVYPVNWKAFSIGKDAAIEWTATKDRAEARLDAGKAAHRDAAPQSGHDRRSDDHHQPALLRRAAEHRVPPDAE